MYTDDFLFTSESVAEGHPDKVCDQISDAVLDDVIRQDKSGRVACETYITMGLTIIGGEITTSGYVDIHKLTRNLLKEIGYIHPKYGLDYNTCAILNAIHSQSPDIAQGVDIGGAGDQGTMIGYAIDGNPEFMPFPIMLAHKIVMRLAEVRKKNILKYLGPDGKAQVTVRFKNRKPVSVENVILAAQHTEEVLDPTGKYMKEDAKQELIEVVIKPAIGEKFIDKNTKYYVNETGRFLIGGPQSDTGMTGRKIIVDTYGGWVLHGGGAFSGKDPTKVDRSAAYMSRYISKNIVASGIANEITVMLSYCIGVPEPVAINVDTHGTGKIPESRIIEIIKKVFPLTPKGIIQHLDLLRPIYRKTSVYGHFGRDDSDFTWEKIDKIKEIQNEV